MGGGGNIGLWSSRRHGAAIASVRLVPLFAGATEVGTSPSARHEMWFAGEPEPTLLALQGHPEFVPSLVEELITPALRKLMTADELTEMEESFRKPLHNKVVLEICRRFLKREAGDG